MMTSDSSCSDNHGVPLTQDVQGKSSDVLIRDGYANNVAGGMGGAPPDEEIFGTSVCVVKEHIYQRIYAPVPIETRGLVVEWTAATEELTLWASTQTPHEPLAF
jgi:aerobic carbon-monoxide dehydrogenase large subunit